MTRNRGLLIGVMGWFILACNLSGVTATEAVVSIPATSEKTPIRVTVAPSYTPESTVALPPSDIPFSIDCSALPESRQKECDAFIANTRDVAYPILREVTGVSLSDCYKEIRYVITTKEPRAGAGGISQGDVITLMADYSLDLITRSDVHELLHTITMCTKAMDDHVFHGLILNYTYGRQGVYRAGYFKDQANEKDQVDFLLKGIDTSQGADLIDKCRGILQRKVTLAYFEKSDAAKILALYRSTSSPQPQNAPNAVMKSIWGSLSPKIQAIVEGLQSGFGYSLEVPACGL